MIYQKLVDLYRENEDIFKMFLGKADFSQWKDSDAEEINEFRNIIRLLLIKTAKPFLISAEQMNVFKDIELQPELCSSESIKLPFNNIFIDFDGIVTINNENFSGISCAMEGTLLTVFMMGKNFYQERINSIRKNDWEGVWGNNTGHLGFDILLETFNEKTNDLYNNVYKGSKMGKEVINMIINFCLYVNSANTIIECVTPGQNKKRKKQGLADKEPYYLIKIEKKEYANHGETGSGITHSFRYDVRGHFKRFTTGRMAGKHIWCPPHQRGLKNDVYKPSGYLV